MEVLNSPTFLRHNLNSSILVTILMIVLIIPEHLIKLLEPNVIYTLVIFLFLTVLSILFLIQFYFNLTDYCNITKIKIPIAITVVSYLFLLLSITTILIDKSNNIRASVSVTTVFLFLISVFSVLSLMVGFILLGYKLYKSTNTYPHIRTVGVLYTIIVPVITTTNLIFTGSSISRYVEPFEFLAEVVPPIIVIFLYRKIREVQQNSL